MIDLNEDLKECGTPCVPNKTELLCNGKLCVPNRNFIDMKWYALCSQKEGSGRKLNEKQLKRKKRKENVWYAMCP